MDQVAERTGVLERAWAAPGETALDLGEQACRQLFARVGGMPDDIDAVLFCTQSPDHVMPPNACLLQHRLGLPTTVAAFDYTLACSGFVYGLYMAHALVAAGSARRVLLVTADTYSKWMHADDRGPVTLFGDGAAATLVGDDGRALHAFVLGTDGGGAPHFCVPAGGARMPRTTETAREVTDPTGNVRSAEHLHMNGAAVLDFVKRTVPRAVDDVLTRAKLTRDDVDLAVFHQGSQMTLDYVNRASRIPLEKQYSNLSLVGNTVSASLPIALCDAEREGRLRPGMRVLLLGFGVGLSWGGCIVQW